MLKMALWGAILLAIRINAFEFIGGEITGVLNSGGYIVTETIFVPKGKTLSVSPGVTFYFEQFSGIKVSGELHCNGTSDKPILFTSRKELPDSGKKYVPESFDWNGIEINSESSCAIFNYTHIRYCTFGVQVKSDETRIIMRDVVFSEIGYSSLTRSTKLVEVQQNFPFDISWNVSQPDPGTVDFNNHTRKSGVHKSKKTKLAVQLGSGGITLCGSVMLICSSILASKNRELYGAQKNPDDAYYYRKEFNKNRYWQYAGGALLTIGSVALGLTIVF